MPDRILNTIDSFLGLRFVQQVLVLNRNPLRFGCAIGNTVRTVGQESQVHLARQRGVERDFHLVAPKVPDHDSVVEPYAAAEPSVDKASALMPGRVSFRAASRRSSSQTRGMNSSV